jgi:hypothetical protein
MAKAKRPGPEKKKRRRLQPGWRRLFTEVTKSGKPTKGLLQTTRSEFPTLLTNMPLVL